MNDTGSKLTGPDLTMGVPLDMVADEAMLQGHVDGEAVLLVRRGTSLFAMGATCTHYGAPLGDGLLVDDTVRCPWHHACFSLRTGEALRAPALDPIACWRVEIRDGAADDAGRAMVYVREKLDRTQQPKPLDTAGLPASVLIIGGGAAGNAAAEMLRREGYAGPVTMLSADAALPCDRPNLSKGYLAGAMPMAANFFRTAGFYEEQAIDLRLGTAVARIDVAEARVELADGSRLDYGALLLATGAAPVHLTIPGSDLPHVHYLRTVADSAAIVAKLAAVRNVVVIGASFIGLEVAASLQSRGLAVHVVGLEQVPMERILGVAVGNFIRDLHEKHGVVFHLGTTVTAIGERSVTLASGETLEADLVVIGIGVRPVTALAEQAGLAMDRGVVVNEYLETSAPHIFAAGDIARWPDRLSGGSIRVEHFVVAERQGQTAARNILGREEVFDAVPFFWTEQYDFSLAYVGHAEHWDEMMVEGDLEQRDCTITYRSKGRDVAVAAIHQDLAGVRAEAKFEDIMARQGARTA